MAEIIGRCRNAVRTPGYLPAATHKRPSPIMKYEKSSKVFTIQRKMNVSIHTQSSHLPKINGEMR